MSFFVMMSILWWFQKGRILGYELLHSYMKMAVGYTYFYEFSSMSQYSLPYSFVHAISKYFPAVSNSYLSVWPSDTVAFQIFSKHSADPAASPTALHPFSLPRQFFLNYSFRTAAFHVNFSIPLLSRKRQFQSQKRLQQHYWLQLTA